MRTIWIALLLLLPAPRPQSLPQSQPQARPELDTPTHQLVFHAILEGLYHDGVSNAVVDAALEMDPEVQWPKYFIYSCPLCMPAIDAFRTYRARVEFLGRKMRKDTFGSGLPDHVNEALLSADPAVRILALRERIEVWVERRVEMMRLTDRERTRLTYEFEDMRKQGLAFLSSYRGGGGTMYDHMEFCPSCEGANMGLKR